MSWVSMVCRAAVALCAVVVCLGVFVGAAEADGRGFVVPNQLTLEEMALERRVALVIGNSNYKDSPLKNPINDAREMSKTLKAMGFDVTALTDANQKTMKRSIVEFGRKIKGGGVALFFFAGHGMQVNGRNYLIPVGSVIESESDIEIEAVDVGAVLAKMDVARTRLNLVVLDACRNNPFKRSFRSGDKGLAFANAPSGTLVAYATAPGDVASDGKGQKNGVFTGTLIKHMKTPGLEIGRMFRRVRTEVKASTKGRQIPWESSALEGEFFFVIPNESLTDAGEGQQAKPADQKALAGPIRKCEGGDSTACNDVGMSYFRAGENRKAVDYFHKACVSGLPLGCYNLGNEYSSGRGVTRDEAIGTTYYRKACGLKHAGACNQAGFSYFSGRGVKQDYAEAIAWFEKGCGFKHATSCSNLGNEHANGRGVPKDYTKANVYYRKACDLDHAGACHQTGLSHLNARGTRKNVNEAAKWFEKGCKLKDAEACNYAGFNYYMGRGVKQSNANAVRYFAKGCELKDPTACSNLGNEHTNGRGVPKDPVKGTKFYLKACDLGHKGACNQAGQSYKEGRGVKKNIAEAIKWFERSCDEGFGEACDNLGDDYTHGRGVAKDPVKGNNFYRRGCNMSYGAACNELGFSHFSGRGTKKSYPNAVKWFEKGCNFKHATSCSNLGNEFATGRGVSKNVARAVEFYRKACDLKHSGACEQLKSYCKSKRYPHCK